MIKKNIVYLALVLVMANCKIAVAEESYEAESAASRVTAKKKCEAACSALKTVQGSLMKIPGAPKTCAPSYCADDANLQKYGYQTADDLKSEAEQEAAEQEKKKKHDEYCSAHAGASQCK